MEDKQDIVDQIEGRNSVLELLESDKDINKIFVQKGEKHGSLDSTFRHNKRRYFYRLN